MERGDLWVRRWKEGDLRDVEEVADVVEVVDVVVGGEVVFPVGVEVAVLVPEVVVVVVHKGRGSSRTGSPSSGSMAALSNP